MNTPTTWNIKDFFGAIKQTYFTGTERSSYVDPVGNYTPEYKAHCVITYLEEKNTFECGYDAIETIAMDLHCSSNCLRAWVIEFQNEFRKRMNGILRGGEEGRKAMYEKNIRDIHNILEVESFEIPHKSGLNLRQIDPFKMKAASIKVRNQRLRVRRGQDLH